MILNRRYSNIFLYISWKGAETMSNILKGQFVKVPQDKKINKIVNKTVNINQKAAMNELLKNPKLIGTLQKLSLV